MITGKHLLTKISSFLTAGFINHLHNHHGLQILEEVPYQDCPRLTELTLTDDQEIFFTKDLCLYRKFMRQHAFTTIAIKDIRAQALVDLSATGLRQRKVRSKIKGHDERFAKREDELDQDLRELTSGEETSGEETSEAEEL